MLLDLFLDSAGIHLGVGETPRALLSAVQAAQCFLVSGILVERLGMRTPENISVLTLVPFPFV